MKSPRHHGRAKPLAWIYFTFLSIRHFLFLITLATALNAQSLTEQDCTIQLQDTGEKILNWTGHVGRTYFIQSSPDLIHWSWAPNIEAGKNRPMSYEVDGPTNAGFYRLQYTDLTAPNLEAADFDGDGLSNLAEITQRPRPTAATRNQSLQSSSALPVQNGTRQISSKSARATLSASIQTNPLKTDTDGDGLTDKWEEDHQLDPTDDGSNNPNNGPNGDPDGDGLDNLSEIQNGTDPMNQDTDGDGASDSDDYHSAPVVRPVIWTHNFIEAWASKSTSFFREFEPTISSGDSTPIVRWYMQKEYSYLDEQSTSFPTSYYDSWKVTYRVDPDSREVTSWGTREPREQGQEQWLDFTNGNWYLESQSHHEVTKTRVFDESIDHATLRTLGITGVQTWRAETNLSDEFTTAMLLEDLGERFDELQRERARDPWNFGGSGITGITSFISRSEEKTLKMKCDYAMEPPARPASSNVRIAWLEVSEPNPYRGYIAIDDDPRPPVVKLYQEFFTAARLAQFNRPIDSSQPAFPKTTVHTLSPDQNQEMKVIPLACELRLDHRLGTLVASQQTGDAMAAAPDWAAPGNGSLEWSISGTLGNRPPANASPQNNDVLWDEFNVPIRLEVIEGAENIRFAARSDSGSGLDTFRPVTLPIADLREYPSGFVLQSTGPGRVVIRASLVTKHGLRIVSTTESLMGLLDLDVDSDNSGEIDGSLAEDEMEADPAQTGKLFVYTPSSGDAPGSPESWVEMSLKTSSLRANDKVQFNYDDDQMTIWNSRPDQNPPADQRVVGRGVYTLTELGIVPGTPKSFYVRPGQECSGRQLISVHIIAANANNGTSSDQVAVNLLPVEVAVDADRDGEITFDQKDKTTAEKPFRFWINNDEDNVEADEPILVETPDSFDNDIIQTKRDLEDFCRLKLNVGLSNQTLRDGDFQIGLMFRGSSGATPGIRIWKNQSDVGNLDYLKDHNAATAQIALGAFEKFPPLQVTLIPKDYWATRNDSTAHLIFEGTSKGKGELVVTIHDKYGAKLGEGSGIWMDLLDVREMYQRARVANEAEQIPSPATNPTPPAQTWIWDPWNWSYSEDPQATEKTAVFVHGWRLKYMDYMNWSDSSYKRLWHQGFKGKFYSFRWATFSGDNNGLPYGYDENIEGTAFPPGGTTYNASEYRAWLCGPTLASFVNQLPNAGNRSLFAHSMGNVISGAALRSGMLIDRYAMCNAAMAAMAYDPDPILRNVDNIFIPGTIPELRDTPDTDPDPAIRTNYGLENKFNLPGMPEVFNFGLPDDAALGSWSANNLFFKPNTQYLYTENSVLQPFPLVYQATPVSSFRSVTAVPEAMGCVTKSRTRAAGADLRTNGVIAAGSKIDMKNWFTDTHSAQWRWSNHSTQLFWEELSSKLELKEENP
jgi:hypothetical protein